MSKVYKVLLIDDHPLIIDAYKSALLHVAKSDSDLQFEMETANTCDKAFSKITEASEEDPFDLIFLDIKLPPSKDDKILSGEDLGVKIRELMDSAKIIVATTFNDNFRINNIQQTVDPDGFLIKNDITPKELVLAINTVLEGATYYSRTVVKLMRQQAQNDFVLDKYSRQLLYELSMGTKMKDLPGILPFSMAGIERRKRHLKEVFNVSKKDDKILIQVAKDKGFL